MRKRPYDFPLVHRPMNIMSSAEAYMAMGFAIAPGISPARRILVNMMREITREGCV